MSEDLKEIVPRLLKVAIADKNTPELYRKLAIQNVALPIAYEWTGCYFLTLSADIAYCDDDSDSLRSVTDPINRFYACVVGAEKFSELSFLVPPKPSDGMTCTTCMGTGKTVMLNVYLRCDKCLGVGWLQKDESSPWYAA